MSKNKSRSIAAGILFPVAALGAFWFWQARSAVPDSVPAAPIVRTISVSQTDNYIGLKTSGFARGGQRAEIAPLASGRVVKIFKHEGEAVKQGDLIAILDAPQASAQAAAARAGVAALNDTLREAERYYAQLVDEAKAGHDSSDGDSEVADEAVQSAKRARDLQIQNVRSQLVAAQGSLAIANAGQGSLRVVAPFAGILTSLHVREGGFAAFGLPLASLATPDDLEIETYLPGSESRELTVGGIASIRTNDGAPLTGTVTHISPGAEPQSLKTLVRIHIDDVSGAVRLGDFVRATLTVPRPGQSISVPRSAILVRGGDPSVFVVDENDLAREQAVTISNEQAGSVTVASGLADGQRVVIEGQQNLINGIKVSPYAN